MHRLRRKIRLACRHWPVFLHAGLVVLVFRIGLFIFPYRKLKNWVPAASGAKGSELQLWLAMWAVDHTARLIPKATCLTQALAAQYLCARGGRETHIRIGVIRDGTSMRAHAWLVEDERVLIGGAEENLEHFTTLTNLGRTAS